MVSNYLLAFWFAKIPKRVHDQTEKRAQLVDYRNLNGKYAYDILIEETHRGIV